MGFLRSLMEGRRSLAAPYFKDFRLVKMAASNWLCRETAGVVKWTGPEKQTLADNPAFMEGFGKIPPRSFLFGYIDVRRAVAGWLLDVKSPPSVAPVFFSCRAEQDVVIAESRGGVGLAGFFMGLLDAEKACGR